MNSINGHDISRSPIVEGFQHKRTAVAVAVESSGGTMYRSTTYRCFPVTLALKAAWLDLGLYVERKTIYWRRRLVSQWRWSIGRRLWRWPRDAVAMLWWTSFGWLFRQKWLLLWWISVEFCSRYWGESGGSLASGGLGRPYRGRHNGCFFVLFCFAAEVRIF